MAAPRPGGIQPNGDQVHAENLVYYHPHLKNQSQVLEVMKWCDDIGGSFILRNSFSIPGALTVSVWYKKGTKSDGLKHFNIKSKDDRFFLQNQWFSTVAELISFYAKHDIPSEEGLKGLRLEHPITDIDRGYIDLTRPQRKINRTTSEDIPPPPPPRRHDSAPGCLLDEEDPHHLPLPVRGASLSDTFQSLGPPPKVPDQPRPWPIRDMEWNKFNRSSTGSDSSSSDSAFDTVQVPTRVPGNRKGQEQRSKSSSDINPGLAFNRPPPPRKSVS